MTTFAPHQDFDARRQELDERTRLAWSAYADGLLELSGAPYEEAEGRSWDRLQRKLEQLRQERDLLERALDEPTRRR